MKFIKTIARAAVVLALTCACLPAAAAPKANFKVIPMPREVVYTDNASPFVLRDGVKVYYPADDTTLAKYAGLLAGYIKEQTGITLVPSAGSGSDGISLAVSGEGKPEGYTLTVKADGVTITAPDNGGVFYGIQTLRKSLPAGKTASVELPAVSVSDYPRFGYRGAHLDVSRHFFTTDSIKRFIDILAMHNMNRLHWHLTDDQGWRIEIKKHPRLAAEGSKRKGTAIKNLPGEFDGIPHGGFYTQDEARDIIAYAADRNIIVIPEIDMPGHMQAALAVYPELGCTGGPYEVWQDWGITNEVLCAGNDRIYDFIDDVLAEIIDIFPSEYIHIGGDECPKFRWQECPKCQAKIKELGLVSDGHHTAEQLLQNHVMDHAEKFVNARGRKIIGWDEILEGKVSPTATIMSWQGIDGGITAARSGHDVIMTPTAYLYFDYFQSREPNEPHGCFNYVPVDKVYSFDPVPPVLTPEEGKHILGVQANMWTERLFHFTDVEYQALPRYAALSEIQWVDPSTKDYTMFLRRLPQLMDIYEVYGFNYAPHLRRLNQPLE